jgi:hypothetical protein
MSFAVSVEGGVTNFDTSLPKPVVNPIRAIRLKVVQDFEQNVSVCWV